MRLAIPFAFVTLAVVAPIRVKAQDAPGSAPAEHGVRFFQAAGANPVLVDIRRQPVLAHRISVHLDGASLGDALAEISRRAGVSLMYSKETLPLDHRVYLSAEHITVAGALSEVLFDVGVDIVLSSGKQVVVVKRPVGARLVQDSTGTIVGTVTDAKTHEPIDGVTVQLGNLRVGAVTDSKGAFRIANVPAGTYTLSARRIGYDPASRSVILEAGQEVTVDFSMNARATLLNETVTTGTVVATEVGAIPTPVSVINVDEIAQQHPHTVQEVFRLAVPTAVSWNYAGLPYNTALSVRGANSFGSVGGQMKIFIDGIEAASPTRAGIDPNSIERIEIIRGPEAAAIYGSDAIGGVVQIFTKRGGSDVTHPQVSIEGGFARIQTPYSGYSSVLRQTYSASVRGGGMDASYAFGAGYSRTGEWVLPVSSQSTPSAHGALHLSRGIVTADVSGRYYVQNAPNVFNPELLETGYPPYTKPLYQPAQIQNQTMGVRVTVAPTDWWRNTITAGFDRYAADQTQSQPRLTSTNDTLSTVLYSTQTKAVVAYNTSLLGRFGPTVTASLILGFEYYNLPATIWFTSGALNTTGTIRTAQGQTLTASRTITNNTGYFVQTQLGIRQALFLTAGVRVEQNTNFGDSLSHPVSPRVGLSFVHGLGAVSVKLRSSYGRAIRPPSPGAKSPLLTASSVTLANPHLGPERQSGGDIGVDLAFGSRGSVGVTYYSQTADGLIQLVPLPSDSVPTSQWQNVGRIRNTGVEIEGALTMGTLRLRAQYGYSRSRVAALPPGYVGDLRVGDQTWLVPKHTAGMSIDATLLKHTTISLGLTYVGSWVYYDFVAQYACLGHTGACQPGPGTRNYLMAYPSFVKANTAISRQVLPHLSGFITVDNLANNYAYEANNQTPVMGRITTVGFQLRY